jgi:hypothetical protein
MALGFAVLYKWRLSAWLQDGCFSSSYHFLFSSSEEVRNAKAQAYAN